jgi:nucleotide-binding universal stress UspA family protein
MNRHSETLVGCFRADSLSTPRIVVGVDGTAANWSAVLWAVSEARRADAPLLLVATGSSAAAAAPANTDDLA